METFKVLCEVYNFELFEYCMTSQYARRSVTELNMVFLTKHNTKKLLSY